MTKTVVAEYSVYSEFTLPDGMDIEEAHDYWVKWNTLCVVWNEGDEVVEYDCDDEPSFPDMKHPNSVSIEDY